MQGLIPFPARYRQAKRRDLGRVTQLPSSLTLPASLSRSQDEQLVLQLDKLKQLGQGVPALRAEAKSLASRLAEAEEAAASLRIHLTSAERQLERAVEDSRAECGSLEAQLSSLRAESNAAAAAADSALEMVRADLQSRVDEAERLSRQARDEQAQAAVALRDLQAEVSGLESERRERERERADLASQLSAARGGGVSAAESLSRVSDDVARLTEELSACRRDLDQATDQVQELRSRLKATESGREAAEQVRL